MEEARGGEPILVKPMQAFPLTKDLVTNTSWAYETDMRIVPINGPDEPDWEFHQEEAERIQEFRSCIECMLCVNTCHVLREHKKFDEFAGPRFFVRLAGLEMHPLDTENRIPHIKDDFGIGYCNITKCCTEVCPAGIKITDNAIIPLKERVVTEFYDPLAIVARRLGIKEKLPKPSPRLYVGDANVKVARRALEKERGRAENARKLERKRVERARGKG